MSRAQSYGLPGLLMPFFDRERTGSLALLSLPLSDFAEERARSHQYGGPSVFGIDPPPGEAARRTGPCAR